jgi:hypothetical protein
MRLAVALLCIGLFAVGLTSGCGSMGDRRQVGAYPLKRKLVTWQTVVNQPVEEVHDAVLAGLRDLKLRPITNNVDRLTGLVDGVMADGMDFEISLSAVGPETTKLSIQCGMLGDAQRSRLIFSAIEKHL